MWQSRWLVRPKERICPWQWPKERSSHLIQRKKKLRLFRPPHQLKLEAKARKRVSKTKRMNLLLLEAPPLWTMQVLVTAEPVKWPFLKQERRDNSRREQRNCAALLFASWVTSIQAKP